RPLEIRRDRRVSNTGRGSRVHLKRHSNTITKSVDAPAREEVPMQRAFVIRAFGKKKDRAGREIDFDQIQAVLIDPALKAVGLGGSTTGEIIEAVNIRESIFGLILEADIVVCDMTIHNANVFYELGI